ncbi:hypothetical protein D3C79_651380 [compost metagenome]
MARPGPAWPRIRRRRRPVARRPRQTARLPSEPSPAPAHPVPARRLQVAGPPIRPAAAPPAGLARAGRHPGSGRRHCPGPARPGPAHRGSALHRRHPAQHPDQLRARALPQVPPGQRPLVQAPPLARTPALPRVPRRQPLAFQADPAAVPARTAHPSRQPGPPRPGRQRPGRAWPGSALSARQQLHCSARWPAACVPARRTRSGHPGGRTHPSVSGAGRHAAARRPRQAPAGR